MDLGATVCTPKNPKCDVCPWQKVCAAFARGEADQFPKKAPKKPKPIWVADAFVLRGENGEWGLERRPEKGLLGGMEGFPTTKWGEERADFKPPLEGDWVQVGEIKHTFTHLHLHLRVWRLKAPVRLWPNALRRVSKAEFSPKNLPTAMKKVAVSVQDFEANPGLFSDNPNCK
jgi:A/G-specific adenine glycosylase